MAELRQSPQWVKSKLLAAVPETMRAVAIDQFGGPEVLALQTLPVPELDADEVLIALHTVGVGPWDLWLRESGYGQRKTRFPLVLGVDGSGIVMARGSRVRRFKVGDAVYAYSWNNPKGGFYADYVAVNARLVDRIPEHLDMKRAGAAAVTGLTALQGIDDALHVGKDQTVVVHGATGGVGTLAVQFAKLRGAQVFATAHGRGGLRLLKKLGADWPIEGDPQTINSKLEQQAPDGVDAILALVGGEALERAIDAVRPRGWVAFPRGIQPEPKKRRGLTFIRYSAVSGIAEFRRLGRAINDMKLQVPIAETFPLAKVADAHRRIAAGNVAGKVVLSIGK